MSTSSLTPEQHSELVVAVGGHCQLKRRTLTHALLTGSPALETGSALAPGSGGNACENSDQRGALRPRFVTCDIGAYEHACGDDLVDAIEECDDGGTAAGDGCDAACRIEECYSCSGEPSVCTLLPVATMCDDGNPCTFADACLAGGICVGDENAGICRQAPKSLLSIKDNDEDKKDKIIWKWANGDETLTASLGDPLTTEDYSLCLYDQSGALSAPGSIFRGTAPAAGTCPGGQGGKPCWKAKGNPPGLKGYGYKDKGATPDGVTKILLKTGPSERAKTLVKGKGANLSGRALGLPAPPLNLPIRVQLVASNGECWEAIYGLPQTRVNGPGKFKAKIP